MRFSVVWRYVPLLRRLRWRQKPRRSRSGGAVRGRHWRVWHGGRRRAIFLRLSIREGMAKGRIRRGTWGGHGAFLGMNLVSREGVNASLQ